MDRSEITDIMILILRKHPIYIDAIMLVNKVNPRALVENASSVVPTNHVTFGKLVKNRPVSESIDKMKLVAVLVRKPAHEQVLKLAFKLCGGNNK